MSLEYLRHLVIVIFCSICLYVQYCSSANGIINNIIQQLQILHSETPSSSLLSILDLRPLFESASKIRKNLES